MVICKYFQTGNCRFGSKCVNEHIDIKQIIKSEAEAAVKGSQWPLSSFGPFKEKPCIPNFVEDQSFEEIRFLCYEAKKQNCFPQFQQQFSQQIHEAQSKMNQLLALSPDVINIVTKIYENGSDTNKAGTVSNPFGSFGSNSSNSSNLFGNSQLQSNPFAKSASTVFGAGSTNPSNNFFGNSTQNTSNIFANSTPQTSIFGGNQQPQQSQSNNIFGGQTTGSIFGGQTQTQQNESIFGGGKITQSGFNQNQTFNNSVFGGNNLNNSSIFGSNQTSQQANLFQQPSSATAGNIFGQPTIQQQSQQPFGVQSSQPQNTGFNNPNSQNTPFTFSSFLQGSSQNIPNQNSSTFFQQPQLQQNQSIANQVPFSNINQPASNESIFTQVSQPQQQQQQISNQINAFDQTEAFSNQPFSQSGFNQQQNSSSLFGEQQTQAQTSVSENTSQNIFAQAMNSLNNNSNPFEKTVNSNIQLGQNDLTVSTDIYSRIESLSSDDLEAFKADNFVLGKIPVEPPPRELCF